jgi:nucleoside-diphosphate-sugar epimerase
LYGDRLVDEDEALLKSGSIYGQTKAFNEFMASKFEAKYGLEIPSVRISAVYGTGREARGVTAWTSQMVAAAVTGKPIKIGLRPDQQANFIYVDDAAEQLVRLALAEKLAHRVYNSGGTTRTTSDFAAIAKKYCPEAEIDFDENAPRWPYPHLIDGSRLEREIGFKVRDPEEGLLEQINQERAAKGMAPLPRKA